MRYLALCAIVKDETPFLKEWIAYHRLLGVEHFIIYDNMSTPPVQDVLGAYAGPDILTIRRVQGKSMQMPCYQNCLEEFGPNFKWIGFLDLDEFVCPMQDTDIRLLLSEFEPYAALGLNWRMFSSCGHLKRPKDLVLRSYTEALSHEEDLADVYIKSFVQPARTLSIHTPHACSYAPGEYAVSEEHRPIPHTSPFALSSGRLGCINHYYYRSQQDFEHKLKRGRADYAEPHAAHIFDKFYEQAKAKTIRDKKITRFIPKLERLMAHNSIAPPPHPCPAAQTLEDHMAASIALMHTGKLAEAQLCLCYAALRFANQAELWILRAMLARLDTNLVRAEYFLQQALKLQERPQAYLELIRLRLLQNRKQEARSLSLFLFGLLKCRDILTPEWQAILNELPCKEE